MKTITCKIEDMDKFTGIIWVQGHKTQRDIIRVQLGLKSDYDAMVLTQLIQNDAHCIDDPEQGISGGYEIPGDMCTDYWQSVLELEQLGYVETYIWGNPPLKYIDINYQLVGIRLLHWMVVPGEEEWLDETNEWIDRCNVGEERARQDRVCHLKSITYRKYLKTDHWQNERRKALRRARHRCQLCGKRNNLNVHHRTYENRGEERPEDLTVLCEHCHGKFHDKLPKQPM